MPAPNRTAILRRARIAFRDHGRGFVVVLDDRQEPHYGFLSELEKRLEDDLVAKTMGTMLYQGRWGEVYSGPCPLEAHGVPVS